jgi:2-phospho-L-lactate guanylyltransferase
LARVPQLALAFCVDTAAAASASPLVERIVVVTDDEAARSALGGLRGVRFEADPSGGLNAAIAAGLRATTGAVVVLPADLPALTPEALDAALALAAAHPAAMVADHSGQGTTLLAARVPDALSPRFGEGSRRLHEQAGHVVLEVGETSPLRWDVDTADDLAVAVGLGVGAATARAVAESFAGA